MKTKGLPRRFAPPTRGRRPREEVRALKGQSMFEVIFAIGIAAIILVAVASLATRSIANQTFSRNNALATKYAQEGVECLRQQRDYALSTTGWDTFKTAAFGTKNLNSSAPNTCIGGGTQVPGDPTFKRQADFDAISDDEINVVVRVEWIDGAGTHQVRAPTTFTSWNK